MRNNIIVFDLDDTLYYEIDFLKSAFIEIAQLLSNYLDEKLPSSIIFENMIQNYMDGENVFKKTLNELGISSITIKDLIYKYRHHKPNISLSKETLEVLTYLKKDAQLAIITDGRSIQQRLKIEALGLNKYIKMNDIIISEDIGTEKPSELNFKLIEKKYKVKNAQFFYIGDNIKKDFVTPNKLGWRTICLLNNGKNIHSQDVVVSPEFEPQFKIKSILELKGIIK